MSFVSAVASLAFRTTAFAGVGGAVGYGTMQGNVWGPPEESANVVNNLSERAGLDGSVS